MDVKRSFPGLWPAVLEPTIPQTEEALAGNQCPFHLFQGVICQVPTRGKTGPVVCPAAYSHRQESPEMIVTSLEPDMQYLTVGVCWWKGVVKE